MKIDQLKITHWEYIKMYKKLYTWDDDIFEHIRVRKNLRSTISKQFKLDLINFMVEFDVNNNLYMEIGSYGGDTCRVMSHYFKKVIGIDQPGLVEQCNLKYKDIDNMSFIAVDLYHPNFDIISETKVEQSVDFILIDAGHTHPQCLSDYKNALKLNPKYIAFDDYGLYVKDVVDDLVKQNKLKIIKGVGDRDVLVAATNTSHENLKIEGTEGVICEVIYD